MALFTHQYSTNAPAEVNPAADYFSAVVVCKNYVASRSKHTGTTYSSEYQRYEAEGFRFLGHVPGVPGKMSTDVVMVRPADLAVAANAQYYGSKFAGFEVFTSEALGDLCRVQFSYDWGNNFTARVIAGDCNKAEMRRHLMTLAGADADSVAAWFDRK